MMPEEVLQGSRVQRGDAANGETPQVELHSLRPGPKYRTMEEVEAARQLEYLATQVESEQQARREIPQPDGQPARDTVAECAAGEAARQRQQA